jgi:hypothetical protein
MKKLALLLLLLPFMALAQNITITGTIKDAVTNEPVEMASIGAADSNISTISNETGNFRLTLPQSTEKIYFSHLNYNTYILMPDKKDQSIDIRMEPNTIELEEVVITNQPINGLLKAAVDASEKRFEKSILLNTYYREFAKINNNYLKFADGLLDYYIKRKSGAADLYVQQSRAKQLIPNGQQVFKKIKYTKDDNNTDLSAAMNVYDVRDAISDASNFKGVKKILDDKKYNYELKLRKNSNGKNVEIVKITPKPEVHELLFEGHVIYEADTKLILEIELETAESHKQYSEMINVLLFKLRINHMGKKVAFRTDNGKYIMAYSQNRSSFYILNKNQFDDTWDFMSDVVTIDYKEGEFEFDKKKRYKNKDLFSAGNNYTSEYWKTSNMLLLTADEDKILKSFE